MKLNLTNTSVKDTAEPFILQKDVILCRSGIQLYHKSEVASYITEDNKPAVEKEWYREYRPAAVIVKAQEKCKSLPVTKEHPIDWVTSENFSQLAGGVTSNDISIVALQGESEGEIGIQSNLTFFTQELYNYYLDNKEVSLGYTCKKHFVDNPEEVGYDIILDEIVTINHVAITRAGRGGSSVSIIDTILGGLKQMRSNFFGALIAKKQTDSKESFGERVYNAVIKAKDEKDKELNYVFDAINSFKDSEKKANIIAVVTDAFENKEKLKGNEEEFKKVIDEMWVSLSGDSLKEIVEMCASLKGNTSSVKDSEDKKEGKKEEDSEDKKEGKKEEDSEDKKEGKKEEDSEDKKKGKKEEDSEDKKKGKKEEDSEDKKKEGTKDSSPLNKEDILKLMAENLAPLVKDSIKEVLGIKDSKGYGGMPAGSGESTVDISEYDYSKFI